MHQRECGGIIVETDKSKAVIMKRNIGSLIGFTMGATDGEIGKVKDFYFDDHTWTIRYLIVDTGGWLSGRKVLISPQSLLNTDWENKVFPVNLTKEQVENSPDIDTDQPVSRQQEIELNQYYPWTFWGDGFGPGSLWGGGIGTTGMMMGTLTPFGGIPYGDENDQEPKKVEGDPQLRSCDQVKGYTISATDGAIGDVEDFIVDDNNWKIDFIEVDTGNWLPGKKVLISPSWIKDIDWPTSSVAVNASIDQVKNSPEYNPDQPLTEEYQSHLHQHYGGVV